jgi:DNA-binding YbaB/EbfC family protein
MRGELGQLMQQAQRMQENLQRAQEDLAKLEVTGQSGGGMVSVTMNGRHEVRSVRIDRKLFADDPEMAEDLVAAAINDAVNKISETSKQRMSEVAGGMGLPPGFKLPF